MPPLSAYTPFESLLFFQSLATSDVRPASFGSISTLLCNNPLVRQNVAFSADRLSPEALEDLYSTLLRDGFDRESLPLGPSNPKKRKIASPRPEGLSEGATHADVIPELVSHLYARYRELVTKEIRDDERRYTEIRNEIERLQKDGGKLAVPGTKEAAKAEQVEPMDVDVKQETLRQERLDATVPAEQQPQADKPQVVIAPGQTRETQGPATQQPTAQLPPSQPQLDETPVKGGQPSQPQMVNGQNVPQAPIPPALAQRTQQTAPATPGATRPSVAHPSQVAPRPNVPAATPMAASKAAASQAIPAQSSFQQWQLDPSPQSPYPVISPSTTAPPAGAAAPKQPLSLSQPPPYKMGSIPSNVPSTPGAQTPVPIGNPRVSQTPSVVIPSFSESRASRPRLSIDTPGSSTPWKRSPRQSIAGSPVSPARPGPGDVSPISDRAPSPDAMDVSPPRERKTRRGQAAAGAEKAGPSIKTEKPSTRSKRAASNVSSRSRGRSVTPRVVSPEQEDTERESRTSGRRQAAAADTDEQVAKTRSKRKRGTSEAMESEPTPAELPKVDTSKYVMCTRGFHRTAAPILNDVATHKLASIFAKPLGERDAPGYHDLIYRPQDLKSIKSAVHQGSKAVAAATEAASTPAGDGESPAPAAGTPSKHNVLMLPKSEDLLPPKGIVNSAQLEKELIRMFANAIMYNPPTQRLRPHVPMYTDRGSRESTQSADGDEGGIIQDTLEMFEDVEQAVTHWRAAERTADELANKNVLSLRRGSASDFNTDSADDAKG